MPLTEKQRQRPLSFVDRVTVVWMLLDASTHLGMEAGYLWLALTTTAMKTDSFNAFVWREYGRADSRWSGRDPTIIAIELPTVVLLGPLCLLVAWAVTTRKPWRHCVQAVICVMELYGGWMTFAPEWFSGSPSLDTSNPVYLWIYLVFMNGLWVVLPGLLLWESLAQITRACNVAKTEGSDLRRVEGGAAGPGTGWWWGIVALLVLYCVLVPLVLFVYADPLPPQL